MSTNETGLRVQAELTNSSGPGCGDRVLELAQSFGAVHDDGGPLGSEAICEGDSASSGRLGTEPLHTFVGVARDGRDALQIEQSVRVSVRELDHSLGRGSRKGRKGSQRARGRG